MKRWIGIALLFAASAALAEEPTLIRFGRGFAAEEQVWLMSARPDLTPNQGRKYRLKQILFQANPERFQAFLAGELDAGTAPGLAVIFVRAQGVDMKIVASICQEAAGKQWFSTTYMVKADGPIRSAKDLKGGTVGIVGYKTATDLWARAGLLNAGLVPDRDAKVFSLGFPAMGEAVRSGKVQAGTFVEPFYSAEVAKGGLRKLFTAVEAVGYDHELLDVWFGEKFLEAHPDVVRAFLSDYVAVTRYYL
ncbi:MAG TPA: ABC transporter substrate-binding protein, partial [Burkholderiales bacterium]|nr:ABC transporter substrate-binding protein [Burkholderiales bacterium]